MKREVTRLRINTYREAGKVYGLKITGGNIHDFLKESRVKYYGGKCPVYLVEWFPFGSRVVVGGNYATNGKPELKPFEELDFD